MKKINIVCVGKLKEQYLKDGIAEYTKRLSRYASVTVKEITDYATDDNTCIEKESSLILPALKGYVIVLDIGGKQLTSPELAQSVDRAFVTNSEVTFVIGGSKGFDDRVRKKADMTLSFGKVTFPHQLVRLMLFEQIYRSFCITEGTPYHK
ncbi:MAG: 23S rRNA (pseudouridine(1915)-N(3))-methyltransferase RlmH [Clostridia bacterium]|nr:23S rRNA (pseudouridine(1915)-N(3))-methyltransferase RlmH [Clostridia bacterium]